MKPKKKHLGTKAKIRAEKEIERKIATAIFTTLILLTIILSAYFGYSFLNQPQSQTESSQLRAAIVDQLSLTFPNQTFIETATNILKQANYTIDYYPGEKVTVEFYRNLPTHGYRLIILRVHSTATNPEMTERPVTLFTSERYDRKYIHEQLTDQLAMVAFSQDEMEKGITYFGINPPFVTNSMKGNFRNTMVIMMGCEGLNNTKMAEALIQKGAKVYISWKGSVSASHTDTATIRLLQHLITEEQTIKQAVENTMKEVGPDPTYNSILLYYPIEAGEENVGDVH